MGVGRKIGISRITIGRLPGKVHGTPEKFENATITGHFGFVFEENSAREIT